MGVKLGGVLRRISATLVVMLVLMAGAYWFGYGVMREFTLHAGAKVAEQNALVFSVTLKREIAHLVQMTRTHWDYSANEKATVPFLERILRTDPSIFAVTHFSRIGTFEDHRWESDLSVTLKDEERLFEVADEELRYLNDRYPFDLEPAHLGTVAVRTAILRGSTPFVRLAVPIKRPQYDSSKEVIGVDLIPDYLPDLFESQSEFLTFVVDSEGNLLAQTDPFHFTLGENLSHLNVLSAIFQSNEDSGHLGYREFPNSPTVYAYFQKIGRTGLAVVSQFDENSLTPVEAKYNQIAGKIILALIVCMFGGGLLLSLRGTSKQPAREEVEPSHEDRAA